MSEISLPGSPAHPPKSEDLKKIQDLQQAIDEVLQHAIEQQNAGQIELAEQLYREIISTQPLHVEANHHLGIIEMHTQNALVALPRFKIAVQNQPENEQFWVSYIDALMLAGSFDEAANALELGVQYGLKPETALVLAKEFAKDMESKRTSDQNEVDNQPIVLRPHEASEFKGEGAIKFIIVAPYYTTKSAGVIVLHELCDSLNKLGHTAAMVLTGSGKFTFSNNASYYSPNLQWHALKDNNEVNDFIRDGIIIYPEIVTGNPLGGKRVVRYLLNAEGVVANNRIEASEEDFILAFSEIYHKSPHAYLTKLPFNPVFNNDNTITSLDRPIDLTYIGKGDRYNQCFVIPNTLEITREWPSTKPELAMLFKNTRFFYTWDVMSQTTTEAFFCGAIPVLMSPLPLKSFDELGVYPMATCTVVGDEVIVNIPDDFEETLAQAKKNYMETVNNYEACLIDVLHKMLEHFSS